MRPGPQNRQSRQQPKDAGVATMIEYLMISGILTGLFIVMMLLVNANFMEGPANTLTYYAFTDIGNGISTTIVDTYAIAPEQGNISSKIEIPDEIAGRGYFVEIGNLNSDDLSTQTVSVWRDSVTTNVSIAGVGYSKKAGGSTTGRGIKKISYDSEGLPL